MSNIKTPFEKIVDLKGVGKKENTRDLNEVIRLAEGENLRPADEDTKRVLLIGIDVQNDFMEEGSLPVTGSHRDVENLTRFVYNNMEHITKIKVSLDTHSIFQVFFPCWFQDINGNNPAPYTIITYADLESRKWIPVFGIKKTLEYVKNLEKLGKSLIIWPYHCLQGTIGHALENQFSNIIHFHSRAKRTTLDKIIKGTDPYSEMYGIIKPEYDTKNYINMELLNDIESYDMIIIAGEAMSHCVLESIKQMAEHFETRPEVTSKIYILEDCMSAITGFEQSTKDMFNIFKTKYNMNIVKSTDLDLSR